jgi:NAD(P)-dependent dehydrogenase (short-subunit alcohol dehydrogenase family)
MDACAEGSVVIDQSALAGRVALVTGGSRGIGAATVRAFHKAGASVFFTYLSSAAGAEALRKELGDRVACGRYDIGDHAALPGLVDACLSAFGALDVLVNNAAVFNLNRFDGTDYDAWRAGWERTFAVNIFGCANLAWLAMRHMRARGGGRIINVASRAGHRGELEFPDYGASKAALINLTKSIARACAGQGITAIAVAPGFVETDMAAYDLAQHRERIIGEVPLGRIGTADEVAAFIAFLATPLATYANGATIDLNGASYVR